MTIRTVHGALVGALAAASIAVAAPPPKGQEGLVRPPHIDVPGPWTASQRPLLAVAPSALPKGAGAHLPAYDGDSFFVTLPVRQRDSVSADEVANEVIAPVLEAIGFKRGLGALRKGPQEGVPQPVADFRTLAEAVEDEYARTPALLRPRTKKMLDVFMGRAPATPEIDATIETGEGMTFAQLVANIERRAIAYPFLQMEGGVPIEHALVLASRWEGQGVTTVHGALFERYTIGNAATLTAQQAVAQAVGELDALPEVKVASMEPLETPVLVLLPYQADPATGVVEMRYAFRAPMEVFWTGHRGRFLVWIDAQKGRLLELVSLIDNAVPARGRVWNRDPGVGTALSSPLFTVDPAAGGRYTLQLDGLTSRVNYVGDHVFEYNALDVSVPDDSDGSSATLANFDQPSINDGARAVCATGGNTAFEQVHFMATLGRQYRTVMGQGIFLPFPARPFTPWIDAPLCNALSSLEMGACEGYYAPDCPDASDGTADRRNWMNFAHDNTVVGHELGHNVTQRLTEDRPADWCGTASCSVPVGLSHLHDLADAWSAHFESTNCFGGWLAKNIGGVDASLACARSDEGGEIPRLHAVATPFDPGRPGDHFPEHPRPDPLLSADYSDGQVAAAALWEVRAGMRSKCRPSGLPQYGVRFQRALKETGFLGFTPRFTDLGQFQYLYDLELQMADQWATSGSPSGPPAFAHNGPHTTNKVTAGFARAGVFLTPYQCLDGSPLTGDRSFCPFGEDGADAVVDVDDNDPADDLVIDGVVHPERDFLRAGGPAPTFLVWTGPRYRLDGAGGVASFNRPSPCNTRFRVEVSNDPAFPAPAIMSPWVAVDVDPGTPESPECFGTWTPTAAQWEELQAGGSRIYFRARTRNAFDGDERLSTRPGGGLWTVPPPYAVITADGRSDY